MNEVEDSQLVHELGRYNFMLYHICSYEQCKQILVLAEREMPAELRDKYVFIINNFKMLGIQERKCDAEMNFIL